MIKLDQVRHTWPENSGFFIDRPKGHAYWTFIHFEESVTVVINGEEIKTEPHSCVIYSPSFPQYYKTETSLIHDWFHFTPDNADIFSKMNIPINNIIHLKHWEYVNRIVKEMELEFLSKMPHSESLIRSLSSELFVKLSRDISGNLMPTVSSNTEPHLRKLREVVFSNLSYHWTVDKMATEVGLSPSRFYSVYRAAYGISPTNDLICARINTAKELLSSTTKSITEISECLGYNNVTHFMRQFHNITGTTPKKYREASRSGL